MADDDPDDGYLFEAALKDVNESVRFTFFTSCNDLLTYLNTRHHLPDLIVLDLNMPGNDGYQCLQAIKKEAGLIHIPVVIYSTSGTPAIVKNAQESGALQYLIKPSSMQLIRDIISGLLVMPVTA
jgi:CheY-like chemotaxis protein